MLSRWLRFFLLIILCGVLIGEVAYLHWRPHPPQENAFDPTIIEVSRDAGVDPFLIRALIWRESRFRPGTHGAADERGLMQVTPEAGLRWAKANKIANFQPDMLYDPATNIRAGTWYLARSIRLWSQANVDDPVTFALAEYNAGRSNALKWVDPAQPQSHIAFLDRITYPSTRKYVEVILSQREYYRAALGNSPLYHEVAAAHPAMTQAP